MATDFKELYLIGMDEWGFKGTFAHQGHLVPYNIPKGGPFMLKNLDKT